MKKILKVHFQRILSLFVLFALCVAMVLSGQMTAPVAFADTVTGNLEFDKTNVMNDLEKTTIDGVPFDVKDYPFDEKRDTSVLLFAEYCYSFYSNKQSNYSLYVYVYNPQGLVFDTHSNRNTVQFSVGDTSEYVKYPLLFLNKSEETNYEGLFYKFKVYLTGEQKTSMLEKLNSSERFYHISSIELLEEGAINPHDWNVNAEYRYSGYADGYGSASGGTGDTLTYTKKEGETAVITSEHIGQTYYRPDGNNGTNNYTYDTLQSVYFSVPNSLTERYGTLSEVRAEWLKTMTSWGLVTGGDTKYYDFFKKLVGVDTTQFSAAVDAYVYALLSTNINDRIFAYLPRSGTHGSIPYDEEILWLSYLFYAGNDDNSASTYEVSTESLLKWMSDYHDDYDFDRTENFVVEAGEGVLDTVTNCNTPYDGEYLTVDGSTYAYSKALFSSWADEKTVADISNEVNPDLSLTENEIGQSWWESIWGDYHTVSSNTFDGIEGIKQVTDDDIKADSYETCENLYIAESDYDDFKDFYDRSVKDERTVYLLRFDVGEYVTQQVGQGEWDNDGLVTGINGDTNAYIFKTTAYLGFDIIQLTYDNGTQKFVIPVVQSPIDVVSGTTPPPYWQEDGAEWWKIVLAVLALIVLLVILMPILPYIIKAVVWVILLPFRLIAAIVKGIQKAAKKKPKQAATSSPKVQAPQPKAVYRTAKAAGKDNQKTANKDRK